MSGIFHMFTLLKNIIKFHAQHMICCNNDHKNSKFLRVLLLQDFHGFVWTVKAE
jgi:hypothetical protein